MTALLKYDAACRAIAEAHAVDEVKDIRDRVDALRHYARQARNRPAEIQWAEIRFRAERRIGEMKATMLAAGELHKGGRPRKTSDKTQEVFKPTLADLEIDDRLSARADALASIEPNSFERLVARWRAYQEKTTDRVSLNLIKDDKDTKRKAEHAERIFAGGKVDDLRKLISSGFKASTILADPPWHFMARSEKGEGRSASQHYTTDRLGEITSLPVRDLAAPDATLIMWMVDWCPKLAFEVIEAWGFVHKTTAFTWAKLTEGHDGTPKFDNVITDRDFHFGQGYWTRANPEDAWLATRGSPKRMNADVRQLIVHPVLEHSRKPDCVHDRIERLLEGPYLEVYARRERDGWITWGNELAFRMPTPTIDGESFDPSTGEIEESEKKETREQGEAA